MSSFKIATWNVNSLKVRLHHVLRWLEENQPDVLGLQETKMTDDVFPAEEIRAAGYEVVFAGQKTYNGVAVLARKEIANTLTADVVTDLPGIEDPQRRVMVVTVNGVRVVNLYVPNGEALDSPKFEYKTRWITALHAYLQEQLAAHDKLVMMGDFNITTDDADVYDPAEWGDGIHASAIEREWLQGLKDLGVIDTFRQFEQDAKSFSWWDYRGGSFWKNKGLRIDYVFASEAMSNVCTECRIDKRERQFKQPSDHAPVIATFDI